MKIISGGQTGVDRAALDVALQHGIACGGWCPAGRLDEFDQIPARYPVQEIPHGDYSARTRQNVSESDGTVIIYDRRLSGGSSETVRFCRELNRPHQLIDASTLSTETAADMIRDFLAKQKIDILNVAGPRQSQWPGGYDYVVRTLERFFGQPRPEDKCL